MINIVSPCSKLVAACKSPAQEPDFRVEIIKISVREFPPQDVSAKTVSFESLKENSEQELASPALFHNEKYNITLKVLTSNSLGDYQDFQQNLQDLSTIFDTNILNDIKTTKPAAISVETDISSAIKSGHPMIGLMAIMANEETIDLIKAVNFISETGDNILMPPCQLKSALRRNELYHGNSDELLSFEKFRAFVTSLEQDFENKPSVTSGRLQIRTIQ